MLARIERLKVCVNGGRSRADHPAIPLLPAEVAAEAAASVTAGAEAVHVHPRATNGAESLEVADVAAAVTAIRLHCPGIPVGVSTGVWITGGDHAARLAHVAGWRDLPAASRPDFASVNLSEPGWAEICALLDAVGIALEGGVWSVADAHRLRSAAPVNWLRILVEVIDVPAADAVDVADEILRCLDDAVVSAPRLLHGEGESCWPLIAHAGRVGLATRVGLEDTTLRPDGSVASGNAELIELALLVWSGR